MTVIIYPYKMGSGSARELSQRLQARRVYADRNYRGRPRHVVINWGSSVVPNWAGNVRDIINHPNIVARTTNKLSYFNHLGEVAPHLLPRFATDRQGAQELFQHGKVVVARTVLNGHSGNGIVVCREEDELPDARLYTLHCRHRDEYRVHVFDGQIISEQQKKRRAGMEEENAADTMVRNYDNGWVFCRENVVLPDSVRNVAIEAVTKSGLVFGAVDIAHRVGDDKAYALEINTAPNIVNTTAEHYARAVVQYIHNHY